MKPLYEKISCGLLIVLFVALAATSAARKSATVDEFAHLPAGLYAWKTRDFSLYGKTPPTGRMIAVIPALFFNARIPAKISFDGIGEDSAWYPWIYADYFFTHNINDYPRLLFSCRLMIIAVSALICLLVWRVARKLYGLAGGILSLGFCMLSPTLMAHARFVTTDMLASLFCLLFIAALYDYLRRPAIRYALLIAASVGLGVLTKFTMIFFAPVALLGPAVTYLFGRKGQESLPKKGVLAGHAGMIIFIVWLMIVAGYLGKGVSFNSIDPQSGLLRAVSPVLRIVPLPRDFAAGLDRQLYDAETGEFSGGNYLFGEWFSGSKWYYYPTAVLIKEPVPHLAVFILASFIILFKKPRDRIEVLLLGIAAAYFCFASFFGSLQIGIRYLLPIYPVCFILMGKAGEYAFSTEEETGDDEDDADSITVKKRGPRRTLRIVIGLFGLWLILDQFMIWPDYLAYFNSFVGGPKNGYKVLLDSNLDWGQDLPGLKKWMDENSVESIDLAYFGHHDPRAFGILGRHDPLRIFDIDLPLKKTRNKYVAVSANYLMGKEYPMTYLGGKWYGVEDVIYTGENLFGIGRKELKDMLSRLEAYRSRKPVAMIGYSIFVYEKSPDQY
jgi:hypothetical protein